MDLPSDMDPECVELCEALNQLPGVKTTSSCCGHGAKPYRIFFTVEKLEHLPPVLYYFDVCHCGRSDWRVFACTDCGMSPAYFCIEGPCGEGAFNDSKLIARLFLQHTMKSVADDSFPPNGKSTKKIVIDGHGGHLCAAYLPDRGMHAVGDTIEQAIGRLVRENKEEFNVSVQILPCETTAYDRSKT